MHALVRTPIVDVLARGLIVACLIASVLTVTGTHPTSAATPFRTRHVALADLRRGELPWTHEPRLALPASPPVDRNGVPFHRVGGRLYYRPGALAINAMKRIDAFIETGSQPQLDQALAQARALRHLAVDRRRAWWMPFWYDYLPESQHAPWVNAMSQGLILSLFVRLHRVTGDAVHLEAAHRVFRSFLRLRPGRFWVSYVDGRGYLWLEHYPLPRPDHVLNAHLHAIFGIYEYWQLTRSRAARRILRGAIATMRDHAALYRRPGGVSLYGLVHRERIVKYHEIHVWQLRLLGRISGDRYFWRLAGRLARDLRPTGYVPGKPQLVRRPPWD